MKIATYNINGIRARIGPLTDWLAAARPDVVVLQETKCVDEGFPAAHFADLGFRVETHGQKSFNGVAILSRLPLSDIGRGLAGDGTDDQARFISATVEGSRPVRLFGLYLPNGNPAPGPKFDYKLAWMERLRVQAQELIRSEEPAVILGDYNIIPQAEDAARPNVWRTDALFRPESRAAWRRMVNLGLTDAFRAVHPHMPPMAPPGHYTFWDFQANAWERNDGIRIDHLLLTPQAADLLIDAGIDAQARGAEKPSDHVPVWITLNA